MWGDLFNFAHVTLRSVANDEKRNKSTIGSQQFTLIQMNTHGYDCATYHRYERLTKSTEVKIKSKFQTAFVWKMPSSLNYSSDCYLWNTEENTRIIFNGSNTVNK